MGLMNGQTHGFFCYGTAKISGCSQRNPYKTEESKLPHYSMEQ